MELSYDVAVLNSYDDGYNFLVSDKVVTCEGDSGGPVFEHEGTLSPRSLVGVIFGQDWHFVPPGLVQATTTTYLHFPWIESVVPDLYDPIGSEELWTAQQFQGSLETFVVDVDGDRRADAVAIKQDVITVRRSSGAHFGVEEIWATAAHFGTIATAFADVDGDGRADSIAVNANRITVRRSMAAASSDPENWTSGMFAGEVGTFFADVDGDRRADAIAVNTMNIKVRRSNGRAFATEETWSTTAHHGPTGAFIADVDGDGRADSIAANRGRITVRLSTGASFAPTANVSVIEVDDSLLSLRFADLDGDHRVDALVFNTWGLVGHASTGAVFGDGVQLALGISSGYVADVNGDRQADFIVSTSDGMKVWLRRPYPLP